MQAGILDRHIQQSKKMLQGHLANDYGSATRRKQMKNFNERANSMNADIATNHRVRKELDFLNASEAKKKQYVQQMFIKEKKMHDLSKDNEIKNKHMHLLENQQLLNQNERQSYDREAQFKSRYNYFNDFQGKVADSYSKKVLSPELQKQYNFDKLVRQQVEDRNKKLDEMDRYKQTFYHNWKKDNKDVIVNQMSHQKDVQKDEQGKRDLERRERLAKQEQINTVEYLEQQQRKKLQSKYKEMLDSQRKVKHEYKSYGNMTNVEKCMNRNDLLAWKNYDYTTYALIPGVNSDNLRLSQKVEEQRNKKIKTRDLDKEMQRLNIYHHNINSMRNELVNPDYSPGNQSFNNGYSSTLEPPPEQQMNDRNVQSKNDLRNASKPSHNRNQSVDAIRSMQSTTQRLSHPKYSKHHLYTPFDPINGTLQQQSIQNGSQGGNIHLRHSFAF